ncbi:MULTISPECIES: hypothetical protein [Alcaligenes]|uniref:hypothetical protein n=1 Tax=Alcaligenes TaxID=507 RepID=UPI00202F69F8|nr:MULTISPECIES: hypothetical protein [Alcaligenes]URW83912.1 hypothetical protein NBV64_06040 [Alcaligenes sp. DN25]WEA68750.1 hypothetical protein PWH35_06050 [Alcaligenes faecalis]
MYLTEETIRAVLVAAINTCGARESVDELIKTTVGALIAADRELLNHEEVNQSVTSGAR